MKDMEKAREYWETLQNVPVRNDYIMEDWHIFKKGTHMNTVWEWFEKEFNVSVLYDFILPEDPELKALMDLFENNTPK